MIFARFDDEGVFNVQSQTNNNGPQDDLDWVLVLCDLPDLWTDAALDRMLTHEGYVLSCCPQRDGQANRKILTDWVVAAIGEKTYLDLLADQMTCDQIFHTTDQVG